MAGDREHVSKRRRKQLLHPLDDAFEDAHARRGPRRIKGGGEGGEKELHGCSCSVGNSVISVPERSEWRQRCRQRCDGTVRADGQTAQPTRRQRDHLRHAAAASFKVGGEQTQPDGNTGVAAGRIDGVWDYAGRGRRLVRIRRLGGRRVAGESHGGGGGDGKVGGDVGEGGADDGCLRCLLLGSGGRCEGSSK